jgi:hypothetical protein
MSASAFAWFVAIVGWASAALLLWQGRRLAARVVALTEQRNELQDTFPRWSFCPACGFALVEMTGVPCSVGQCTNCGWTVLESDAEWIDPSLLVGPFVVAKRLEVGGDDA